MKSKQLKNTLGAITVSEDRIERTMAYIRAEKVDAARKKEGYSPKITFVTRLAGAMCALLLVVGIGIYGFGSHQPKAEPQQPVDMLSMRAVDTSEEAVTRAADEMQGEWVILDGKLLSCAPASGQELAFLVSIEVQEVQSTSHGLILEQNTLQALLHFDSVQEIDTFLAALPMQAHLLLGVDTTGDTPVFSLEKIVLKK